MAILDEFSWNPPKLPSKKPKEMLSFSARGEKDEKSDFFWFLVIFLIYTKIEGKVDFLLKLAQFHQFCAQG